MGTGSNEVAAHRRLVSRQVGGPPVLESMTRSPRAFWPSVWPRLAVSPIVYMASSPVMTTSQRRSARPDVRRVATIMATKGSESRAPAAACLGRPATGRRPAFNTASDLAMVLPSPGRGQRPRPAVPPVEDARSRQHQGYADAGLPGRLVSAFLLPLGTQFDGECGSTFRLGLEPLAGEETVRSAAGDWDAGGKAMGLRGYEEKPRSYHQEEDRKNNETGPRANVSRS